MNRAPADMIGGVLIGVLLLILGFAFSATECGRARSSNLEHILAQAPK